MKITHCWKKDIVSKDISGDAGFLLTNQKGGYLSLFAVQPSRYAGWFLNFNSKLYKILENIDLTGLPCNEVKNNFWNIERQRGDTKENFLFPKDANGMLYEVSKAQEIEITFDFKESYENNEQAFYEVFEEKGFVFVKLSLASGFSLFLVLKPDRLNYSIQNRAFFKNYSLDKVRNSPPFQREVFKLCKIKCRSVSFGVDVDKLKAKEIALRIFKKARKLKRQEKKFKERILEEPDFIIENPENKMAYFCAKNSLYGFLVEKEKKPLEFWAGFPWFFQFWTRDAGLCLKALAQIDKEKAKQILLSLVGSIRQSGRALKIISQEKKILLDECADGLGWIFKRFSELKENENENYLSRKETQGVENVLLEALDNTIKYFSRDGFILNNDVETWMDTVKRAGVRLEIQVLTLNCLQAAYKITSGAKYLELYRALKQKIKERFWLRGLLSDSPRDFTVRPNIFLSAYVCFDLLTIDEWAEIFKNALNCLWLDWGGISTIDIKNPLFFNIHTGENSLSYHQGDSWFYLNNLTALMLHKVNRNYFKDYIEKILEASTYDLLWQGAAGHHSELSSVDGLQAQGCWAQAWSAAMYMELVEEILKTKN